jgi:3-oxoacyl-[acyl-carrier protein] reductase
VNDLKNKIALVTGGGRGIGAAIARQLVELGAAVIICGRTAAMLEKTAREISADSGRCEPIIGDVSDWNSVSSLAAQVKEKYGRLDVLVNNAGIGGFGGPLHKLPLEQWDAVLNTNLGGVFYMVRAFVPLLHAAGGGHIINISSIAGKNALPNGAAYAASKWGLNGLSYSIAEELRGQNIRVALVCPGSTHTELSPHEGKDPRKMLQPDDVAHAVAMLVTQSPQSFVSELVMRPTQKP